MKKSLLTLILFLSGLSLHAGEKEKAFEQAFRDAVAKSDEATFALVEFNKSTPKMFDEAFKNQLVDIRQRGIKEIEFFDAKETDVIEFTHEGVDYTSTLPIEKRMKIYFEKSKVTVGSESSELVSGTLMIGTKDETYRIVAIKPKE